jgi:hypothetical protein
MNYKNAIIGNLLLLLVPFMSGCANAMDPSGLTAADREKKALEGEEYVRQTVMIGTVTISIPVGRFALMRNGNYACAIRFTNFSRSGESVFYAEYDWYFQNDGSGDFSKANVKNGHGSLKDYDNRFLMLFASKLVVCGSFRLFWGYPVQLGFTPSNTRKPDLGNEMAPSKWTDISEVNIHDARLKWYRRVERDRRIDIPIEKLW